MNYLLYTYIKKENDMLNEELKIQRKHEGKSKEDATIQFVICHLSIANVLLSREINIFNF